jgi:hypothetical protein
MKRSKNGPIGPIIYNLLMVLMFFIIYLLIRKQFGVNKTENNDTVPSVLDIVNLAVTLQTAVGVPMIYPITTLAKTITILQQFLLIFGNLFILHFMNQV